MIKEKRKVGRHFCHPEIASLPCGVAGLRLVNHRSRIDDYLRNFALRQI